jgi:uracil-DNA glycosylase family 4
VRLPLYPETPSLIVETTPPLPLDKGCERCVMSKNPKVKSVCIPPLGISAVDGSTDGPILLVVGEGPGEQENAVNAPFVGSSGKYLKEQLQKHWKGRIVLDNATRCFPGRDGPTDKATEACRPYLANTWKQLHGRLARVLCLGNYAAEGVLGRSPGVTSTRRAYSYASDGTMVFMLLHPAAALRNRFVRKWFEEDLAWALTDTPPTTPQWGTTMEIVARATIGQAVKELRAAEWVTYDCETCGPHHTKEFELSSLSITARGSGHAWVWDGAALKDPVTRTWLCELLKDEKVKKVGQNVKYDNLSVRCALGVEVKGIVFDTRLIRKLQDSDSNADLETLSELVGMGGHKLEAKQHVLEARKRIHKAIKTNDPSLLRGFGRSEELISATMQGVLSQDKGGEGRDIDTYSYGFIKPEVLGRYNARDTISTDLVAELLEERFKRSEFEGNRRVWNTIVLPAYKVIERMEYTGIAADVESIKAFSSYLALEQGVVETRLSHYGDLNWNSPKQVGELLYGRLGLRPDQRFITKNGAYSTSEDALEALRGNHPVIDDLLSYRQLSKLQGTYALGLLPHVRPDGRIHPNFNLDGARSGRLSSSDPNGQNIPSPSNDPEDGPFYGRMARDCFVSMTNQETQRGRARKVLLQFDFSQLELRIAAVMSGDQVMREVFMSKDEKGNPMDYHRRTAEFISQLAWGIPPEKVEKMHRSAAKIINFAVIYGKSDAGIAYDITAKSLQSGGKACSIENARKIKAAIMGKFSTFDRWMKERLKYAQKTGVCHTWWQGQDARTRSLFRIAEHEKATRENAERSSWNCLDDKTEALTQRGWVNGFDLTTDDVLLTKNSVTGLLEWERATDVKKWENYPHPLVEFKSRSFHAVSTRDHRWLVKDKYSGKDICKTTSEVSLYGDHRIHRTGLYAGVAKSSYTDDFVELVGWFLTDGTAPKNTDSITIYQSDRAKPHFVSRIDALTKRIGGFTSSISKRDELVGWRTVVNNPVASKLRTLFPKRELTYEFICELNYKQLLLLLDTMLDGDGTRSTKTSFCARSKVIAEVFQALCVMCGIAANIKSRDMSKYKPTSTLIRGVPKMGTIWIVTLLERKHAQVTLSQSREVISNGRVWCPVVPNTYFVARRSGTVFITGNTPIQGTAADFCTASLSAIDRWLIEDCVPARIVLSVHDSIIIECEEYCIDEVHARVIAIMEGWPANGVPIVVDAEMGYAWGSLKKIPRGMKPSQVLKEANTRAVA